MTDTTDQQLIALDAGTTRLHRRRRLGNLPETLRPNALGDRARSMWSSGNGDGLSSFYFDLQRPESPAQTTITAPHVRRLGDDVAVVCYVRLIQHVDADDRCPRQPASKRLASGSVRKVSGVMSTSTAPVPRRGRWGTPSPGSDPRQPRATITSRSKPNATPVQGGKPCCMAASNRLSAGSRYLPSATRASLAARVRSDQHLGIKQFVVSVGQLDAIHVQLEPFRHWHRQPCELGPEPPGWPDSRTGSSAVRAPTWARHGRPTASPARHRDHHRPMKRVARNLVGEPLVPAAATNIDADRCRHCVETPRHS